MQLKKNIPNAITSLNLMSGCIGILLALRGFVELAALMIILAALFDFMDGMAARRQGTVAERGLAADRRYRRGIQLVGRKGGAIARAWTRSSAA